LSRSPGRTATELRRKLAPEEDLTRIMQPSQVADVIAQLMSDTETTLDGQNIVVRMRSQTGGRRGAQVATCDA